MNEKELAGIIGSGASPYAFLHTLMAAASIQNSKLTKEQKMEREKARRLASEERMRQAKIIENTCPDCDGKLSRGKKDKKNGYKRLWTCNDCGISHSV